MPWRPVCNLQECGAGLEYFIISGLRDFVAAVIRFESQLIGSHRFPDFRRQPQLPENASLNEQFRQALGYGIITAATRLRLGSQRCQPEKGGRDQ
jgi:hypothetical protein